MRVLQLGPYPPPHGGVQANLSAIRDFLLQRQIPCAVINLTRSRKARPDAEVYYPKNALHLAWLLLRLRYDIVHLHIGGNLTPRLLGLTFLCSLMPHSKSVLTFHSGGYPSSPEGRTARPRTLRGLIFRRLDGVIGVNPDIVEMFHRFGVPSHRTRLIYPHALSTPGPETRVPEHLRNFFQSHRPVLITVGLLEPEYDLPLQIEVLGRVHKRFPNAGLLIVGSGSLEGELRERIKARPYAKDILLCGDVEHAVTLRVMSESQALLRTTLYDGDSISVREALHLGVPVIATDNGMRPEGVELIPPSDLDALHLAIEKSLTEGGGPRPRRKEAADENVEAVLEFYRELLGED